MKIASKLFTGKLFFNLLAALGTASAAFAQSESATGTVSGVPNGGAYDYTIVLNNTSSSVSIGSFWYSWTPTFSPFFYLPSPPTSASAPSGWSYFIDGDSIQFTANTSLNDLAPQHSIQFNYSASFSPAQLTGQAGYSYVYSGGIELDPGAFMNVVTVPAPEPSSLGLLATGLLALAFAGHRKLRTSTVTV